MAMAMTPALEIHDLTVQYQHRPVLWAIDTEVPQATLCAIIGPNGAGKSTLIKAALGIVPAASGYARFFGQELNSVKPKVAYVPQREEVDWNFPISVFDLVLMGRYGHRRFWQRLTSDDYQQAESALQITGMLEYKKRLIRELSGGQQQRVFIARAIAQEADLYLLDEPFAGIDAATEVKLLDIFKTIQAEGKTIVCVHHDLHTVYDEFDYALVINLRLISAGKVSEALTEDYLRKAYGANLNILSSLIERMRSQEWIRRETSTE
jgi:manganese/zinc/iron transport system ATP- binding protein